MPQGAPQIDSQAYPDSCSPTFPFHFDFYLSPDIAILNRIKLSFFLRAFRRTLASVNTVTSQASSAASSGSSSASTSANGSFHTHAISTGSGGSTNPGLLMFAGSFFSSDGTSRSASIGNENAHTHGIDHTHGIPHTHDVTPTLVDGIWEGAVAAGVTVKVNGVDRTAALGGGAGFNTNQTELLIDPLWLTLSAWNTIDLTPTGLGRITGHLTVVSYIQSV
jgi:hypothetical protein